MINVYFFLCISLFLSACQSGISSSAKVTVICPTYNRSDRHANLYAAFAHQTYENKELLVLDDSPEPSPFFTNLKDQKVKYQHIPQKMTVGFKRNLLVSRASGELIAHFDDDDYYAPNYLTTMVNHLGSADFVKLSRWLGWRESDGSLWEWDSRLIGETHFFVNGSEQAIRTFDVNNMVATDLTVHLSDWMDASKWGYGFSYVYRKSLWEESPFEDINQGEDYNFLIRARTLDKTVIHVPDFDHIAVHTMHPKSTSYIFPQYRHDTSASLEMLGERAIPWLIRRSPQ